MTFTHLGITAPRRGLSPQQIRALTATLLTAVAGGATHFHMGDCVGGDEIGARAAKALGMRIVCHPPANPRLRAHFPSDEYRPTRPYLERDRELVDELAAAQESGVGGALLGFPTPPEVSRGSGTWYTVRYARHRRIPLLCVAPDGQVLDHYKVEEIYPLTRAMGANPDLRIGAGEGS